MIKFEVKNRWSGEVQFPAKIDCKKSDPLGLKLGLAVNWAISNDTDLRGADLRGANLRGADLRGTGLIPGPILYGYSSWAIVGADGSLTITAGCHTFTPTEARAYWSGKSGREGIEPLIAYFEAIAELGIYGTAPAAPTEGNS